MIPSFHLVTRIYRAILIIALLIMLFVLSLLFLSCRCTHDTVTTSKIDAANLKSTTTTNLFSANIIDTFSFFVLPGDCIASYHNPGSIQQKNLIPIAQVIRHAKIAAKDSAQTNTSVMSTKTVQENKAKSANGRNLQDIFIGLLVVFMVVLLGCMFGVIAYFQLKNT